MGFGRFTFEIRAGEIVQKHFVFCVEERRPTLCEMIEKCAFVGEDFVVAFVKPMRVGDGKIAPQQVGHRAVLEPMPVQPPLAPGVDESVEREGLQNEIPARAFATFRQQFAPINIEPELPPKLASKPAVSTSSRP